MPKEFLAQLSDSSRDQVKIIHITGELDEINVETLKQVVDPLLDDDAVKTLILDLKRLEFINSKGIGYLVSIHTHLSKDARMLCLAAANEAVMDVISLVGLPTIVPYYETLEEAMAKA